jgi:hypothetical protein
VITGLTDKEYSDLVLSVGTHRKKRHRQPGEVAELIEKALLTTDTPRSEKLELIAKELQLRGPSMLERFLSLRSLPPEIVDLITYGTEKGRISFSTAAEFTRLPNTSYQVELAKAVLENDLTKSEVQAILQRVKRGGVSLQTALDEILKLRPKVERRYLFLGKLPPMYSQKDPQFLRRTLRARLGERFGGQSVLAVSCKAGRFSFLLTEAAAKQAAQKGQLTPATLDRFVAELLKDT